MINSFLFFSLIAAFFWSLANVNDKLVLTDHLQNPLFVTFFTGIFGALTSLAVPVVGKASIPSFFVLAGSLILGSFYIVPIYFYMRSLQAENVSRIVPLFSLTPVFALVLGAIFLNEFFTLPQYAGIFLVVTGSIVVSSSRLGREFLHLERNKGFWLIIVSTLLYASYAVGTRWLLQTSGASFWNVFFWSRIGTAIPVMLMLFHKSIRVQIFDLVRSARENRLELMGFSEILNNIAVLAETVALSIGPAALVSTITSTQPLMVLVLVAGMKHVYEKDLGDDLSSKAIAVKTFSSMLMLVGIYLIK